jgi:hypothetical protein
MSAAGDFYPLLADCFLKNVERVVKENERNSLM